VSFRSERTPASGPARDVLDEEMTVHAKTLRFCAATVGNPHCVVLDDQPSAETAKRFGPLLERDARFPNRTNVQFMKVIDRHNVRIEIWERGAGYTLASGSSSTAAAGVAYRLGLCDAEITVHMPGGRLQIQFQDGFHAIMTGPVTKVCEGDVADEMFDEDLLAASPGLD